MVVKQLSVFIENRQGRLGEVLEVLKSNDVNILSISLADTTEYGILRLIVNNPDVGKDILLKEGFSALVSDVIIIKISHKAGSLQKFLKILSDADISIEYMYGLSIDGASASIVLKISDTEKAKALLIANGIDTLSGEDISKL